MTNKFSTMDLPEVYEIDRLASGAEYHQHHTDPSHFIGIVKWTEPGLYITRLRVLSDPGYPFWDVSYCHGRIGDKTCNVELPFSRLPRPGLERAIVQAAIKDGVYARGIGILDNISTLV